MLHILALLALLFCFFTFAATLFYWYEVPSTDGQDIRPLTMNTRNVLHLWLLTVVGIMGALAGRLLWLPYQLGLMRLNRDHYSLEGLDGPPVLMVHGLYHDSTAWIFFQRRLARAGFSRQHCVRFYSLSITMDVLASTVERGVQHLERSYPGVKPLLVGHSLGGLAIRAWLAEENNASRVQGALTLGTPHRGSRMAALAVGPLGRSLLPGHAFFRELARREEKALVPCVALATRGDCMVLPLTNLAPMTPGWRLRVTPLTSHLGMLLSASVFRMAAWELYRMSLPEVATATDVAPREDAADTRIT